MGHAPARHIEPPLPLPVPDWVGVGLVVARVVWAVVGLFFAGVTGRVVGTVAVIVG